MQCKRVSSSEHGRKRAMGRASGFQPARQLLMMPWLCGDPLLPRVPAPSSPLPPAASLALFVPGCHQAEMVVGLMGTATHLCPGCVTAPVPVGWHRGGTPAALWRPLSPSFFFLFRRQMMQHEAEQMVAVSTKKSSFGAGMSSAGEVMSGDDLFFYCCINWASTARLKPCICMTPLSFSSFLWLSLPSCLRSHPATARYNAGSKEIRQNHSALLAVNWVRRLIKLQLYRLKLRLSWQAQKLLSTFCALQLAVHRFVSHLPTSGTYLVLSVFSETTNE